MKLIFTLLSLFALNGLWGQGEEELRNYNHVYQENIRSVKLHLNGAPLTNPLLDLNSSGLLTLTFDDMNEDVRDFVYTIVHCDKNWEDSGLDELDFLEGYTGERIDDYEFSFNTISEYTNYVLQLPNEDIRWTISGNYLLHVFEDNNKKTPVLTRRFLVVDPRMQVEVEMVTPSVVSKYKTHQEFDFVVNHQGVEVANPRREITTTVLQNGRWDNAITNLSPGFIKGDNLLFDLQDKVIFPGGKEFRFVDLRTFRYPTEKVADIVKEEYFYDVVLKKEESRTFRNYQTYVDINGRFVIEHLEEDNPDLEGDYASVLFALGVTQELFDTDVYLMGDFSDWQIKEEFKLVYNPAVAGYVGRVLLKQGYYNYNYVTVAEGSKEVDHEALEGNWHQTENEYTVLVYYRPFGARYDHLVSAYTFASNNWRENKR